eukprot:Sdes_comp18109_c0_seq1m7553
MGILKKLFSKCPSPDFDQEVERISHSFLQKDASPKKLAPRFSHSRRFASEGSLVISPTSPSLTSGSTFVSHHQDSATLLSKNGDVNAEDPYMFSRYFDPSKVGSLRHSLASTNESNYIDHSKIERYSSHRDSHSSESRTIILPHSRFKNRPTLSAQSIMAPPIFLIPPPHLCLHLWTIPISHLSIVTRHHSCQIVWKLVKNYSKNQGISAEQVSAITKNQFLWLLFKRSILHPIPTQSPICQNMPPTLNTTQKPTLLKFCAPLMMIPSPAKNPQSNL